MTNNQPLTKYQQDLMDAARHYASAMTFFDTSLTNKAKAAKELEQAKVRFRALVARAVDGDTAGIYIKVGEDEQ